MARTGQMPGDALPLRELRERYGISDSNLRLWLRKGELTGHGARPVQVSEAALVALLEAKGREVTPHEPGPDGCDDPELTRHEVSEILGVSVHTVSDYRSKGVLADYRRSTVLDRKAAREAEDGRRKTGVAEYRAIREKFAAKREEIKYLADADKVYDAEHVDAMAGEVGRLLADLAQGGRTQLVAEIRILLTEHGYEPPAELQRGLVDTVGAWLDRKVDGVLAVAKSMVPTDSD